MKEQNMNSPCLMIFLWSQWVGAAPTARAIAHARLWLGSHCPLPEPMFNVATFFLPAGRLHGS
jgi:hypothetical protein